MVNITRKEIADHFLKIGVELDPVQAYNYVNQIIEVLVERLSNGEDILISNFGKFSVKQKGTRKGRNPKTGEEVMISPRRVVTFHPSSFFREHIQKSE